jgi:hypothetical protein
MRHFALSKWLEGLGLGQNQAAQVEVVVAP